MGTGERAQGTGKGARKGAQGQEKGLRKRGTGTPKGTQGHPRPPAPSPKAAAPAGIARNSFYFSKDEQGVTGLQNTEPRPRASVSGAGEGTQDPGGTWGHTGTGGGGTLAQNMPWGGQRPFGAPSPNPEGFIPVLGWGGGIPHHTRGCPQGWGHLSPRFCHPKSPHQDKPHPSLIWDQPQILPPRPSGII